MQSYQVTPVNNEIAQEVRQTLKAPGYGHPAYVDVARGYGPCRVCLQTFTVDRDQRILFTHDPFAGHEPFPLPGPIYIHADACVPYAETSRFPDGLRFIPLTFHGYADERRIRAQERIDDGKVEEIVDRLFADPLIDYIHVRNTEAGCFIARIDREPHR
jgi:Protein of unknown function (DUF1203)